MLHRKDQLLALEQLRKAMLGTGMGDVIVVAA